MTKPVSNSNFNQVKKQLLDLLQKKYDSYIFVMGKSCVLNALTLKVVIVFNNSIIKSIGILCNEETKDLFQSLFSENEFIFGKDAKTVLQEMEDRNPD